MARKYETGNIVDPIKAPFTKRSLTHLNAGMTEGLSEIIKGLLGGYVANDLIVLNGCVVTIASGAIPGTGTANNTAGAIYYNGEIYQVDANASLLSTTTPQTLVWQIVTTYISGDPATFSDGNNYNFHRIDKMHLVAAAAGSGLANYDGATVKKLLDFINGTITSTNFTLINGYTVDSTPRFRQDVYGNVRFIGSLISPASGMVDPNCFQVPNSIKPANKLTIPISNSSGTDPNAVMYIETNGNARVYSASSSGVLSPVANSLTFDLRAVKYNPND